MRGSEGEWIPNRLGGRENLEAVEFLRRFNEAVYREHPDTVTIAEESTAWPMVSRPTSMGGLGFGMKWNMGWMHDTLSYMKEDPVHRRHHHHMLTFSLVYAFNENFVLPLSHDEVVHGKGSLIGKMPGDDWQQFANLRALFGLMWAHPGKKLLFMGGEFGQRREWTHEGELEWFVSGMRRPRRRDAASSPTSTASIAANRRCTSSTSRPTASSGSSDDSQTSVIVFLRRPRDRRHARAGGLQPHAGAAHQRGAWACRTPACGASCSTATPSTTAAPAGATSAACARRRCRRTAGRTR